MVRWIVHFKMLVRVLSLPSCPECHIHFLKPSSSLSALESNDPSCLCLKSVWVTAHLLIECWQLTWFLASQQQQAQHATYGWDRVVWGGYMLWKWAGCLVDVAGDGPSKGCTHLLQNWLPPDVVKKKMEVTSCEEGNINENRVLGLYWNWG